MATMSHIPSIDLHVHTLHSDGVSGVVDVIRQAETNELEAVAITDHHHMIGIEGITSYAREIREMSKGVPMMVLVGLEIHPKEDLSLPHIDKGVNGIDLILADPLGEGVDAINGLGKEEALDHFARTYGIICENPEIDILAHPLNLGRFEQFKLFSDVDPWLLDHLIKGAKRGNKCLEVMSGMSWWFPKSRVDRFTREYAAFIRQALDEGVKFSIGSDAHCVHGVGNTRWSHKVLNEAGATADDVIDISAKGKL